MKRYALAALASILAICAARADSVLIVPTTVIYPRDVIRDDMLEERTYASGVQTNGYVASRGALVGRVARLTLLPGRPVPPSAVEEPRLVTIGSQVRIVFDAMGVTITAFGSSLQNAAAGDLIRVRNNDSGQIVSGKVQSDGSVRVGES